MRPLITACAAAALCATAGLAAAQQGYPARPIRMLVPFAPGGGTDISARVIGHKMTEQLTRRSSSTTTKTFPPHQGEG